MEAAYQQVARRYPPGQVVIAGYSLGTGPAAWLAGRHPAKLLLLHAPYFSMTDMAARTVPVWPILPSWLLRYPLPTNKFVGRVSAPVVLVHGDQDTVIPAGSAVRLQKLAGPHCRLLIIPTAGHNDLTAAPAYRQALKMLLP